MRNKNWSYKDVVKNITKFKRLCHQGNMSERAAAKEIEVPRTTLRHWNEQRKSTLIPESIQTALLTEDGLSFLQTILTSIQFIVTQVSKGGIRMVELFLKLTGLSSIISSSYGTLHERGVVMENYINEFGVDEKERLAKDMPHKHISLAKDETFNKNKPCLVAIEPVSNFIINEKYTNTRTEQDWSEALEEALSGLNVTIIQNVNDAGAAIKKYNKDHHETANESKDLFHILTKMNQSLAGPLSSKKRSVEKKFKAAAQMLEQKQAKTRRLSVSNDKPKHKKDKLNKVNKECEEIETEQLLGSKMLQNIAAWKKRFGIANKNISALYHPYNLETGEIITVEELQSGLKAQFSEIKSVAEEMSLSEKSIRRIETASNDITLMLSTMRFYFNRVDSLIDSQTLTLPIEKLLKELLIPIEYLKIAANKEQVASDRDTIMKIADQLNKKLEMHELWNIKNAEDKNRLRAFALECAQTFQRSSSCVEGRNSHLTLWHHGVGAINIRKSSSISIVSNYFIERADNTTAAERFFEKKPKNLFHYLLTKMPLPSRSRKTDVLKPEKLSMAA